MLCQMEEACSENAGGKEVEKGEGQMKKYEKVGQTP